MTTIATNAAAPSDVSTNVSTMTTTASSAAQTAQRVCWGNALKRFLASRE